MRKIRSKSQSYNNIFIIGMPGIGKSTFGRIYACFSGRNFLDFDDFLEKSLNTTISKIFQLQGVQNFRALEFQVLQSLAGKTNHVIALGGGTLTSKENDIFARAHGLVVSLVSSSLKQLAERIWNDKLDSTKRTRPLFEKCVNIEEITIKLSELYHERSATYEKADVVLNQDYNSTDTLMLALINVEQNFDKEENSCVSSKTER